ncbi:AMP-binding protein, partial [Aldersonia kunmingensis]|uniref:AMP-binding protein n=1 Tax=Aldersonia kunmingensis TaxID=408066 RepID=UPI000A473463
LSGTPGPVYIEYPSHVIQEELDVPPVLPPERYRLVGQTAGQDKVTEAADLIRAAKQPVLIVGHGVHTSRAQATVKELADLMACPVIQTSGGTSYIPGLEDRTFPYGFSAAGLEAVVHQLGAFDPEDMLDTLEREGTTSVFMVPVQWQAVCAAQKAKPRNLKLKNISWGAAPASDTVLNAMNETFPQAPNVTAFGQTEMSPVTCILEGKDALRKIGSVGKVVPAVTARIVDPMMNDVKPGEVGEIVYRGPNLMKGYWQNPEGTADAFRGGWFHSGDLVRQDDEGFLYVVDRAKDMIISGGENIYCAEVENVLFGHPDISEAAVIGRAHEKWGEVPVAVVALVDGVDNLTIVDLEAHLNENLARFKHPKDLVIVDELPRNASGKVLKHELRKSYGSKDAGLAN